MRGAPAAAAETVRNGASPPPPAQLSLRISNDNSRKIAKGKILRFVLLLQISVRSKGLFLLVRVPHGHACTCAQWERRHRRGASEFAGLVGVLLILFCAHRVHAHHSLSWHAHSMRAHVMVLTVMLCACTGHTAEPWRWERLRRRVMESVFKYTSARRAAGTLLWCRGCVSDAVAARA